MVTSSQTQIPKDVLNRWKHVLGRLRKIILTLLQNNNGKHVSEIEELFIHYNWKKHLPFLDSFVKKWFGNWNGFGYNVFNEIRECVYNNTCDECGRFFCEINEFRIDNDFYNIHRDLHICDECLKRFPQLNNIPKKRKVFKCKKLI